MKYEIIGREVEITPAMKEHIENKLSTIEKYFLIKEDTKARIVVKVHKNDQKVEITIPTKIAPLRSEVTHDDFYSAVDLAIDKLEGQIRKEKTRLAKRKRKDSFTENFAKELETVNLNEDKLDLKEKDVIVDELSISEAITELELTGHDFYAYKDLTTKEMCVIYKRKEGYGVLHLK